MRKSRRNRPISKKIAGDECREKPKIWTKKNHGVRSRGAATPRSQPESSRSQESRGLDSGSESRGRDSASRATCSCLSDATPELRPNGSARDWLSGLTPGLLQSPRHDKWRALARARGPGDQPGDGRRGARREIQRGGSCFSRPHVSARRASTCRAARTPSSASLKATFAKGTAPPSNQGRVHYRARRRPSRRAGCSVLPITTLHPHGALFCSRCRSGSFILASSTIGVSLVGRGEGRVLEPARVTTGSSYAAQELARSQARVRPFPTPVHAWRGATR